MSSGPLAGLKVIEFADFMGTWAGKLLADMGAEVIKIEPPGGEVTRTYEPFLDDEPGIERSLYFWHYNTNKQSVVLDLETAAGADAFRRLASTADFVVESAAPGEMARLGLDYPDLSPGNERLIYVSITPFGRNTSRAHEAATDITLMSNGGITWMNGYDDHSLPPVRGGGNQAYHTASHYAVMSALTALVYRDVSGKGQHIDVNANACINVTNEAGSYTWLVAQDTVQRQTGRHAAVRPSMPSQLQCADGRWVNTGLPPRNPAAFRATLDWLAESGLIGDFHEAPLLELGMQREMIDLSKLATDEELQAIFGAGRAAMGFIASKLSAYEFFSGAQARGFQVGIIYSPEEVLEDPHFQARGWPTEVEHPEHGRSFIYPGQPYKFEKSPWSIRRRAPLLGEDTEEVLAAAGYTSEEIAGLRTG